MARLDDLLVSCVFVVAIPVMAPSELERDVCQAEGTTHVSTTLERAARGSIADFAQALASAELCGGVVSLRHDVGLLSGTWDSAGAASRPMSEVLAVFAARGGFRSRLIDGFILTQDLDSFAPNSPLARVVPAFDVDSLSAIDTLHRVVAQLSPELAEVGGRVGSALGPVDGPPPAEAEVYGPLLRLQIARAPLLDVLIQVGKVSPGVVWLVSTDPTSPEAVILRAYTKSGITHTFGGVRPL